MFSETKPPRSIVVAFKVRPAVAKRIRQAAKADARTISSYLAFLVERVLTDEREHADG